MPTQTNVQSSGSSEDGMSGIFVPKWLLIAVLIVVAIPFLMMSLMMLGMGLFGPAMHGGVVGHGPDGVWVLGFVPVLVVGLAIYGVYKLALRNAAT